MLTPEESVREFHEKYWHLIASHPSVPSQVIKDLRLSLCLEEMNEFITAIIQNDFIEMADGAADLVYVVVGTLISYGIPFDRIFQEVHRSNMTKTASKAYEGQKYGEVNPKGPDYIAPNIKDILDHPDWPTQLEEMPR